MKFLGNINTGAVIGSAAFSSKVKSEKMDLLRNGVLVELTGYQRGEDKAIMSRKNGRKYEFKVLKKTEWRNIPQYKADGWVLKKNYDSKTTVDEATI
jgi:hypothetical protein